MSNTIVIYTDGGASGNPGPGGYGAVLKYGSYEKEISAGYRKTTNNRMELLAVIVALEALKNPGTNATVYSDSKYVVDSVEKRWVFAWKKKGFKKKKNVDLWQRFLLIYAKHNIRFEWVKGHSNNPLNDRCDRLAVDAYKKGKLGIDSYYESVENNNNVSDV